MTIRSKNISGFSLTELAVVLGVIGIVLGGIWVAVDAVQEKTKQEQLRRQIAALVDGVRSYYFSKSAIDEPALLVLNRRASSGTTLEAKAFADSTAGNMEFLSEMQREFGGAGLDSTIKTSIESYFSAAAGTIDFASSSLLVLDTPWGKERDSAVLAKQKSLGLGSMAVCAPYLPSGVTKYFATCYPFISVDTGDPAFTPQPYIGVQVLVSTRDRCVGMIANNTGSKAASGFVGVYLNSAAVTLPFVLSTLTADCGKGYNTTTGAAGAANSIAYNSPAVIMFIYKLKPI